ncbi:BIR protein [Plasmodium berghei]|uniref:BIR protein n=2 Tax=Plasmodium berghei TaxID=5821 RepID=A0A509AMR6_PLABA|nr:BIR protein [Plasmodium berghei ANKA]SBW38178.1 BIR protein [Plasmodium berghei]SCL82918.1 BIR protein [Plasmodium berghei]VUC55986.1 BIR protein [Plasmodium berghei ANKA]|eukprot:XP_034421794.1 BIR protein [Plasmodium berghei ANKA]
MNKKVCERFKNVWTNFTYESSNKNYQIKNDNDFKQYCSNQNCVNELEKISAGCLYLFNEFFKDSSVFNSVAKSNIDIVEYIIIWLSYMLNLKPPGSKSNLKHFYDTNINNDKYTKSIDNVEGCSNYKELIDKTNLMNMDIKDISKFYEVFKLLCEMYTEFDENTSDCAKYIAKSNDLFAKYEKLKIDSNITNNNLGCKLLSTLSNDYNNFKMKCKDSSSFPTIEKKQTSAQFSEDTSSSSSIVSKSVLFLSVLVAIAIFLGISYKYSLFGRRKRAQKQYLREKIKNIKKRMNH